MRVYLSDIVYWLGLGICIFNVLLSFSYLLLYNLRFSSGVLKKLAGVGAFFVFSCFTLQSSYLDRGMPWRVLSFAVVSCILLQFVIMRQRELEKTSMELLRAVVGVIEAGDPNLDGHSLNVQNLSMLLYDYLPIRCKLKVNPKALAYASLLLDIGKLGIPRKVIDKPGKLDSDEWFMIKRHPEIGMRILEPIASMEEVREMIMYHHERVDGDGYLQLKGDEIPFGSRIIAVADAYSAITMDRSYKASLSFEDALLELKLSASSQLDPLLVDIFCSIPIRKIKESYEEAKKVMERYGGENFRK
ncbi:MAG: HD domain-containing protein [Lachnospiraceae bacterium]|nr:HD domain-containing protein [Lachnospiraceae bacterium]